MIQHLQFLTFSILAIMCSSSACVTQFCQNIKPVASSALDFNSIFVFI